jgi:hypothetical protein
MRAQQSTSSAESREDSWKSWGTPGVSNILHLGGMRPGTFTTPAIKVTGVTKGHPCCTEAQASAFLGANAIPHERHLRDVLRLNKAVRHGKAGPDAPFNGVFSSPRVVPGSAAVVSSFCGLPCPTARLIALINELLPAFCAPTCQPDTGARVS